MKTGPLHREKSSSLVTLFLNFLILKFYLTYENVEFSCREVTLALFTFYMSKIQVHMSNELFSVKLCHLQEEEAHFRRFVYTCGNSDPDVNKEDYT